MDKLDEGIDDLEWGTLRSCGIYKYATGRSIINNSSRGKFTTGDKSIRKQFPRSRYSVDTFMLRERRGLLVIIQAWQGWESLGIDLGIPVYIPIFFHLFIC